MPLKDILVHVDNSRNGEARIEYAAQLATAHDAHLSGLYVSSPAANADGGGGRSAGLPSLDFGGRSFQEYEKKATKTPRASPPMRRARSSPNEWQPAALPTNGAPWKAP